MRNSEKHLYHIINTNQSAWLMQAADAKESPADVEVAAVGNGHAGQQDKPTSRDTGDRSNQTGTSQGPSINLGNALATMTLEVIGTSAFGCATIDYIVTYSTS